MLVSYKLDEVNILVFIDVGMSCLFLSTFLSKSGIKLYIEIKVSVEK